MIAESHERASWALNREIRERFYEYDIPFVVIGDIYAGGQNKADNWVADPAHLMCYLWSRGWEFRARWDGDLIWRPKSPYDPVETQLDLVLSVPAQRAADGTLLKESHMINGWDGPRFEPEFLLGGWLLST